MVNIDKLKAVAEAIREKEKQDIRNLVAKVVGVSFEARQNILRAVEKDTPLKLERDRRNEYDFYAVKVMAQLNDAWEQAGFLPRRMANMVAKNMDEGINYTAQFHKKVGGGRHEFTGEELNLGLEVIVKPE